jgi:hypothetical protein
MVTKSDHLTPERVELGNARRAAWGYLDVYYYSPNFLTDPSSQHGMMWRFCRSTAPVAARVEILIA